MYLRKTIFLCILLLVISVYGEIQTRSFSVIKVSAGTIEINAGTRHGVEIGYTGSAYFMMKVGGKDIPITTAVFRIISVEEHSSKAQITSPSDTDPVQKGQFVTFDQELKPPQKKVKPTPVTKKPPTKKIEKKPPQSKPKRDIMWLFDQGERFYKEGDYETAKEYFNKVLEQSPDDPGAKRRLKDIENVQKKQYNLKMGERFFQQKDYDTALLYYKKVLEEFPGDSEAERRIKEIEEAQGPPFIRDIKNKAKSARRNSQGFWEAEFEDAGVMLYIPEGEFMRGSENGEIDEKPVHRVYLEGYWIGKYEVTFAHYDRFCSATERKLPDDEGWGRGQRPVLNVSWNDAKAYCDWLSRQTGLRFKLPTEAQWEKAARGTDERRYPWGDSDPICSKANYRGCQRKTMPVGSYPAGVSPYGAHDMAGNVWEWCVDWYDRDYYIYSPSYNPQGASSGSSRVIRGGSWNSYTIDLRSACRGTFNPVRKSYAIGLRLCMEK